VPTRQRALPVPPQSLHVAFHHSRRESAPGGSKAATSEREPANPVPEVISESKLATYRASERNLCLVFWFWFFEGGKDGGTAGKRGVGR